MLCPCGSEKTYEKCCKAYIEEGKKVHNVEVLMRSRYTAFALKNISFRDEKSNHRSLRHAVAPSS